MLQNIYLLNYKNYYERIAENTPAVTKLQSSEVLSSIEQYNFNENDGINTEIIVNNREIDHEANYIIVQDNDTYSCWYIINCSRNLRGQVTYTLRRDLLDDYLDEWLNSTAFIEKGICADSDNAIFNNENMSYNQIKSEEIPLQDASNCQWLVGYYDKTKRVSIKEDGFSIDPYIDVDLSSTPFEEWEYYPITTAKSSTTKSWANVNSVDLRIGQSLLTTSNYYIYDYSENILNYDTNVKQLLGRYQWTDNDSIRNALHSHMGDIMVGVRQGRSEIADNCILTDTTYSEIQSYNNKLIKFSNGIYKVFVETVTVDGPQGTDNRFNFVKGAPDTTAIDEAMTAGGATVYYADNIGGCYYYINGTCVFVQATEWSSLLTESDTYSMNLGSATSNYDTQDAPYGVFVIPYTNGIINGVQQSKELNMALCSKLLTDYTGSSASYIYDIQLLPFCPFEEFLSTTDTKYFTLIKDQDNNDRGTVFFPRKIQCNTTINKPIVVDNYKMENETTFYRLTSPNYDGQFEFSAAKNNGVEFWNVDMTLKPFTPYIHVNPNFKRLYGTNYKDSRGLICGGNFSLTQMSDSWKQYELANKNYQRQFDRQIENMEFNNAKQKEQDIWNAVTGTVGGILSSGQSGSIIGKLAGGGAGAGIGTGIGALVGGVASGIAGAADVRINEQLRNESLDFAKDNFQMQMGNIKALPRTINKLDAFTANTKPYVFVEKYTCSTNEKRMLAEKIIWNGMTINRIGKPLNYKQSWEWTDRGGNVYNNDDSIYLKGQIIRTNADGDYHLWTSLSEEFNKGVYLKYGK
jgi:outer membrane lipoprotein SlyB